LQRSAVYKKVSEQRLDEEQHQKAAGEVQNSRQASGQRQTQCAYTDKNVVTVESLLLSQEDKPQSHRTVREISREADYYNQFHGLFMFKICVSSAARKGALNS